MIQIEILPSPRNIRPSPKMAGSMRMALTRPSTHLMRLRSTTATGTRYTWPESLTGISNDFPTSSFCVRTK